MRARHRVVAVLTAALLPVLASTACADFLVYKVGSGLAALKSSGRSSGATSSGKEPKLYLQGKVTVNPGKTVTYTHPTLKEQLYFSLDSVEIKKARTPRDEFNRRVGAAGKNADELMKAAVFGLKKGLLKEFHAAVDKALEADPQHEAARKVKELKKQIDEPLPDNPQTERDLRNIVKSGSMKLEKSNHFLLLHDTPSKPQGNQKKTRAEVRLELLEKVYESFLLLFHAQDIELDVPRERLKVVLFNEHEDFLEFAKALHPSLVSAAGFYEHTRNTAFFYDHSTTDLFKALRQVQEELGKIADDAKKARTGAELIRFVRTLDLLIDVERENSDINVVSHECTHQMAANTGLLPRHVLIPHWVHEGLATYFECPGDAAWAGIGAVNEMRLEWYRALAEGDRIHSNIDFIVGDQIFDYAATLGAKLHGYGQAWAFTHFMIENHLKEFITYYRMLGEMPPDVILNPELLTQLFNRVFGSDHKALDQEWRAYMRTLKTDIERLEESASESKRK